jgi:periplasmic divalent cation tolerance protein
MPSAKEARKLILFILKEHLIACATIKKIDSIYRWDGKIVKDKEVEVILKTSTDCFEKLESVVKQKHPYKIPCIIKIPVKASDDFGNWVEGECVL